MAVNLVVELDNEKCMYLLGAVLIVGSSKLPSRALKRPTIHGKSEQCLVLSKKLARLRIVEQCKGLQTLHGTV